MLKWKRREYPLAHGSGAVDGSRHSVVKGISFVQIQSLEYDRSVTPFSPSPGGAAGGISIEEQELGLAIIDQMNSAYLFNEL